MHARQQREPKRQRQRHTARRPRTCHENSLQHHDCDRRSRERCWAPQRPARADVAHDTCDRDRRRDLSEDGEHRVRPTTEDRRRDLSEEVRHRVRPTPKSDARSPPSGRSPGPPAQVAASEARRRPPLRQARLPHSPRRLVAAHAPNPKSRCPRPCLGLRRANRTGRHRKASSKKNDPRYVRSASACTKNSALACLEQRLGMLPNPRPRAQALAALRVPEPCAPLRPCAPATAPRARERWAHPQH